MRRIVAVMMCLIISVCMISCGSDKNSKKNVSPGNPQETTEEKSKPKDTRPLDLTKMSSTAVFSEVYNMMVKPEDYVGRKVKIRGNLAVGKEDKAKKTFFYCVIQDATKCCQQGLEFVWKGSHSYPRDYPKEGSEIIVEGTFDLYKDRGNKYCRLKNAEMRPAK